MPSRPVSTKYSNSYSQARRCSLHTSSINLRRCLTGSLPSRMNMAAWKGIVGKGFRPEYFRQYVDSLTFPDWRPQFVIVHYTSAPRLSQWHSTPGATRMLNLESYYRDQMKWSAGPHLFVADDLIWVYSRRSRHPAFNPLRGMRFRGASRSSASMKRRSLPRRPSLP